ncbi:hypothetical protein AAG570_006114 [Ranatra chinensis]|uniref:Reverse transcriptase domain-containing protein n=1 Tax=Ranatra chinensis TaxID=642074 RepID=A0ABD0XX28_9HEMI
MASKRRNLFHENKTQEMTKTGSGARVKGADLDSDSRTKGSSREFKGSSDHNRAFRATRQGTAREDARNFPSKEADGKEKEAQKKLYQPRFKIVAGRIVPVDIVNKEGTPVPQPSSSRMDGSTSAAPHLKKCGPKLDSQPARQHRNGRVSPTNSKNVSARDKKVEETQCRNKDVKVRLKSIEERKAPSYMQEGTPVPQPSSSRMDGSTSAAPHPKKCGPKLDSQPARQHRNGRVSPTNSKNVSARDKKVEETQCRNKGLQERLKRVEERKPTSHMQTHDGATKAGGTDLKEEVSNVPEPEVLARSCGGGSTAHVEYSSVNAENRVEIISTALPPNDISANIAVRHKISPTVSPRKEKEHEGEATRANMSPEYQERTSSEQFHSQVDGPNLHAPIASQHREKKELPNSNRNNSSNYTLREIYAKVNDVEEKMKTLALLEKCCHSNAESHYDADSVYLQATIGAMCAHVLLLSLLWRFRVIVGPDRSRYTTNETAYPFFSAAGEKSEAVSNPQYQGLASDGMIKRLGLLMPQAAHQETEAAPTLEMTPASMMTAPNQERPASDVKPDMVHSPYLVQEHHTGDKIYSSGGYISRLVKTPFKLLEGLNQVEITPPDLPPNGVSTSVEVDTISPAVNSVCPPSRTDEKVSFSDIESLRKEKEHEGEATETNNSPEYKETTPKTQASSSRMDGSASATPQPKKSGSKLDSQPPSQRRNEELRAKNKKNVTFGNKKAEEIRIQNKELRERLRIIKERKTTAVTNVRLQCLKTLDIRKYPRSCKVQVDTGSTSTLINVGVTRTQGWEACAVPCSCIAMNVSRPTPLRGKEWSDTVTVAYGFLEGLNEDAIQIYMDDIIVLSHSEQEHGRHLEQLLQRFKEFGLKASCEKSSFFNPSALPSESGQSDGRMKLTDKERGEVHNHGGYERSIGVGEDSTVRGPCPPVPDPIRTGTPLELMRS